MVDSRSNTNGGYICLDTRSAPAAQYRTTWFPFVWLLCHGQGMTFYSRGYQIGRGKGVIESESSGVVMPFGPAAKRKVNDCVLGW